MCMIQNGLKLILIFCKTSVQKDLIKLLKWSKWLQIFILSQNLPFEAHFGEKLAISMGVNNGLKLKSDAQTKNVTTTHMSGIS